MKTTVGRSRQDMSFFGLSIPSIRQGDEILVQEANWLGDKFLEIATGPFEGAVVKREDFDFDL